MSEMRCDLCGGHHATLRYTEIDDGRTTKRVICRTCAQARGLLDVPARPIEIVQLLLAAAAEPQGDTAAAAVPPGADPTCSECGQTLADFRRSGLLGCARCWTVFESSLVPLLRKLHPRLRHVGKAPRAFARKAELRVHLADLRAELDRAVRGEDYERAATLRDQIRTTESEQSRAARRADESGGRK